MTSPRAITEFYQAADTPPRRAGRHAQPSGDQNIKQALESIEQARKLRPSDPDVFMVIGETLDEHDHHAEAAKWLTTGLVRYLGNLAEITAQDLELDEDASLLVSARRRARGHAGLPKDHLDELAEQEYGSDFYDNEEP